MRDIRSIKLFFFGDSICFGQGVSIHKGWVPRISAALETVSSESDLSVLLSNCSVNGNTTRLALERMPYDIQSHRPEQLIVQFGMNDCNYWQTDGGCPRVSPRAFRANLMEIVERATAFGTSQIFLNTNHPTLKFRETLPGTSLTYQQSNEIYNDIIREVATNYNHVELTDIAEIFDRYVAAKKIELHELVLNDGLHLSERGHDVYFESLYPKVRDSILKG